MLDAEDLHHLSHRLDEVGARHTNDLKRRLDGVRKRTEQVHDRGDREFASHGPCIAHRGVVVWCVEETKAMLVDHVGDGSVGDLDRNAKCLEHIGAARFR